MQTIKQHQQDLLRLRNIKTKTITTRTKHNHTIITMSNIKIQAPPPTTTTMENKLKYVKRDEKVFCFKTKQK